MTEAIIIVAAAYAKTNAISRACEAAVNINILAIGRRHPTRRRFLQYSNLSKILNCFKFVLPSTLENCAHNDLIYFVKHNLPTF